MIRKVAAEDVPALWPRVLPHLERVLARFDYGSSEDDIFADILLGKRVLWVVGDFEAVAITSISAYPQFKTFNISLLVGDGLNGWMEDILAAFEADAAFHGCKYLDGFGRKGWARKLEGYGFKPYSFDIRKEVNGRKE